MMQRGKGERKFQKQMMVAEREGKVIRACCRMRREKGSFRNKCRLLKGRGKGKGMLQREKGERKFQKQNDGC